MAVAGNKLKQPDKQELARRRHPAIIRSSGSFLILELSS